MRKMELYGTFPDHYFPSIFWENLGKLVPLFSHRFLFIDNFLVSPMVTRS